MLVLGRQRFCAVLQKYVDQGISVNTSYNPEHFEENKVPMSQLITDMVTFYKYGGKQLYYNNTHDGSGEMKDDTQTELTRSDFNTDTEYDDYCDSCTKRV